MKIQCIVAVFHENCRGKWECWDDVVDRVKNDGSGMVQLFMFWVGFRDNR